MPLRVFSESLRVQRNSLNYCEAFLESFLACALVTEHSSCLQEAVGGGWQLWVTLTRSGQCNSRADRLDFGEGQEAPAPVWLPPAPGHSFSPCLFAEAVHRAARSSARDAGKEDGGGMQALFSCVRRFPRPGLCSWGKHPGWD